MTTIATRILGPDSLPKPGSTVGLRLVASLNGEAAGLDPTTLGLYQGRRQEQVAGHGWWLADLKANSLISPTNNYYEAAVQVPGRGVARQTFTAPASPLSTTLTSQLAIPASGSFNVAAATTGFPGASASAPKLVVIAGVVIQYTGTTPTAFTGCTTYATTGTYPIGTAVEQAYWLGSVLVDPPAALPSAALTDHLGDAVDAHDASAVSFVPTGTIAATDVQAAIAEVATEGSAAIAGKVAKTGDTMTGQLVLDHAADPPGVVTHQVVRYPNAVNAGANWVASAGGITDTGVIEHVLLAGPNGLWSVYVFKQAVGLVEVCRFTNTEVELMQVGMGLVMRSPNGTRWRVTVGDDGALSTAAA